MNPTINVSPATAKSSQAAVDMEEHPARYAPQISID
jgi:hypothetical protein